MAQASFDINATKELWQRLNGPVKILPDKVTQLIKEGANPNALNHLGIYPLTLAISQHPEAISPLIEGACQTSSGSYVFADPRLKEKTGQQDGNELDAFGRAQSISQEMIDYLNAIWYRQYGIKKERIKIPDESSLRKVIERNREHH